MAFEGEHQLKNNYEKRFHQLHESVKARNVQINRLKNIIKQQNEKIKTKDDYINHFQNIAEQQNEKIKTKDDYINRLKNDTNILNDKIKAVMNSRSWKITEPLRKLNSYFK